MVKIIYAVFLVLALAWVGHDGAWMAPAQAQTVNDGLAVQRTRLVQGLNLKSDQQKKLDVIQAQTRPKLAAAAALPLAQQEPERRKLMDDMHLRINAMLTPDQRAAYELMQAKAEERLKVEAAASVGMPARPVR
ncbi:MAG: hypothetical protein ABI434_00780 [Burkholderiaceae bacterium]